MRHFFYIILFFIFLNGYSQDSTRNFNVGIGGGLMHYPEGKIYGYTHSYFCDYYFSNHFGAKLSLDFGDGQSNEKYYFDLSKSSIIGIGLVYSPLKKMRGFNINSSFIIHKNTRIIGTKDEIINNNFALSEFTTYEKYIIYGLNIGLQFPIAQKNDFLFAAKVDVWASWLKIDAMSLKLLLSYNF